MYIHYLTTNVEGELTTTVFATYDECLRAREKFTRDCWDGIFADDTPYPVADHNDDEGITEAWEQIGQYERATYTFGTHEIPTAPTELFFTLAQSIAEQDHFWAAESSPIGSKQVARLVNGWIDAARAALASKTEGRKIE